MNTSRFLVKTSVAVLSLVTISGCTRIPTGSVGIQQHFDGQIENFGAIPGMYVSIFDKYLPIDTTLTRVSVKNLQPKDSNGVPLKNVQAVVTFRLDPSKVAAFYIKTKERDE